MTPEQTGEDGWKQIRVPDTETLFVIGHRNKVYVVSTAVEYDRTRAADADAIAVLDSYLNNKSGDPVTAAAMRVQSLTVMQAVDN